MVLLAGHMPHGPDDAAEFRPGGRSVAAAESLQEQAVQLGTTLAVFKLAPAGAPAITSAPAVRRLALAQAV